MTIKDIASLAGVSPATVSKVLNNKADSIAEETREKVLRIVKEYNFRPFQKYIQNNSFFGGFVGLLLPGETREYSDFISGAQVTTKPFMNMRLSSSLRPFASATVRKRSPPLYGSLPVAAAQPSCVRMLRLPPVFIEH